VRVSTDHALTLSPLPKTWLIDIDGTVLPHNGHLSGTDALLPSVAALWARFGPEDRIILLTGRAEAHRAETLAVLRAAGLRWDETLFGLPTGERVLINDAKPSGLCTAHAVCVPRDAGLEGVAVAVDEAL